MTLVQLILAEYTVYLCKLKDCVILESLEIFFQKFARKLNTDAEY